MVYRNSSGPGFKSISFFQLIQFGKDCKEGIGKGFFNLFFLFEVSFAKAVQFRRHVFVHLTLGVPVHFFTVCYLSFVYHNWCLSYIETLKDKKVGTGMKKSLKTFLRVKATKLQSYKVTEVYRSDAMQASNIYKFYYSF